MIRLLNEENIEEIIKDGTWIVSYSAKWCGKCQMMKPNIEKISKEYNILEIDVDKSKDLAIKKGIMSIPTIQVYSDGNLQNEIIGYKTNDELNELLKKE